MESEMPIGSEDLKIFISAISSTISRIKARRPAVSSRSGRAWSETSTMSLASNQGRIGSGKGLDFARERLESVRSFFRWHPRQRN
jgi:hypothetical protein